MQKSNSDLHDVILRDGADDPGVVRVPGEVRDLVKSILNPAKTNPVAHLGGVAAVDEEELGRPVLRILRVLLLPDLGAGQG